MNLTIWQFLALVAALVVVYLVYHFWWVDQERNSWIRDMNSWIFKAEQGDLEKKEPEPEQSGWGQ